ncbi:hypothetical protein IFR04_012893 [Cadophora malorum]|uniref:Uncharacterized protein n=1 Tax=Cadophora malorum TaxID=108018 RepID=A0A8H7T6D7_9HELO|nr:hypothetical protein IFR04_012893 [Cadophora malorum]
MPPSIPDPAFWRPSINESYPRIHVGQHWADKSYSVFCFFERIPDNDNTHPSGPILWALHPLGDPLLRQPEWIEFSDFIANMPGQTRPGTWAVNINVCQLVTIELRYRYFQQQQLSLDAPVYDAADLARAAQEKKTRRAAAAQMREQQEIMAANRGFRESREAKEAKEFKEFKKFGKVRDFEDFRQVSLVTQLNHLNQPREAR